MDCPTCGGSGDCYECDGAGLFDFEEDDGDLCPTCDGTGECPDCNGTGEK